MDDLEKVIGCLVYAMSSFVNYFKAVGQFTLGLHSGNNLGQNRRSFVQCDFEIWQMTLKNNRAHLLWQCKLCASFRSQLWIRAGVTVRKSPNWGNFFYLCDLYDTKMGISISGVKLAEVGCYIEEREGKLFIISSPDADGLVDNERTTVFEIKCPTPKPYGHQQLYRLHRYHATQVLNEMNVGTKVDEGFLIAWTEESSTVFKIKNNEEVWKRMCDKTASQLLVPKPHMPKKKTERVKELSAELNEFIETNVTLVCEMPSCRAIPCMHNKNSSESD